MKRLSGLDGLRALAVLAVVTFHFQAGWLPGGFLGVDLFFVISGFLITRLLLTEFTDRGRIGLGDFYRRRARRLLPAALVLIATVTVVSLVAWRDELATLRGSVLSSLTYSTNWWLVGVHQSYFVADGRPPMLQHLWSLAVEEQFYLVWAALLVLVTGVLARRRRPAVRVRVVLATSLGLAAASAVAMAVLAIREDVPYAVDSSRIYFGTDTHAFGLLLGSAAGAWTVLRSLRPGRHRRRAVRLTTSPVVTDLLGLATLAVLVHVLRHVDEYVPALYRGGMFAFDAGAALVILCATREGSWFGRALDARPLRWLGERSYSVYLWHWPVVVVTRPGVDVHGPTWLITSARIALVLALATVSYRFVEQRWRHPRERVAPARRRPRSLVPAAAAIAASAGLLVACGSHHDASNTYPGPPASSPVAAALPSAPPTTTAPTTSTATDSPHRHRRHVVPPSPTLGSVTPVVHRSSSPPSAPAQHHAAAPHGGAGQPAISAFGDSVLLGTAPALQSLDPNVAVDAVVGRQAYDTLGDVVADHAAGRLAPIVVIHTGDNGVIDPGQLRSTLKQLRDRQRVVLINDRVPRDWQDSNNALLARTAKQFPNVVLLDWHALSAGHSSWFYDDQIHLNPSGAPHFARMILEAAES